MKQAFMAQPRVQLSNPIHTPFKSTHTQKINVTVAASSTVSIHRVLVHYRSRGWFRELEMFDDGKHGQSRPRSRSKTSSLPRSRCTRG